jgi:hypothetical protein
MTKVERLVLLFVIVATALVFVFWKEIQTTVGGIKISSVKQERKDKAKNENESGKANKENLKTTDLAIKVIRKWKMPEELKEISGIAPINDKQIACVQDELGKIFIYNIDDSKLEKTIDFGSIGDYEGIAIVKDVAYIIRADGTLFEVANFSSAKPVTKKYRTPLTARQDVEGLCYDAKTNRLLLSIKGEELNTDEYKGIYAFDLSSKKMQTDPVLKIDLTNNFWNKTKKKKKLIQPSDLEVHPVTGDVYIVDGPDSKLLVMANDGTPKELYQLNTDEFPQPEGISFLQTGELLISNEGKKGEGNILQLSVEL